MMQPAMTVIPQPAQEAANADGLAGEEGTFVICSCWLVTCLAEAGFPPAFSHIGLITAAHAIDHAREGSA